MVECRVTAAAIRQRLPSMRALRSSYQKRRWAESWVRLLLDTHALIWWLAGHEALSRRAREPSPTRPTTSRPWRVATKFRIGKLEGAALLAREFEAIIASQGFSDVPISVHHARLAGGMNIELKDPFDRFLIFQAQAEDMVLVPNETLFDTFAVQRLW